MKILKILAKWFFRDNKDPNAVVLDSPILYAALVLMAIGLIMVYSASIAWAQHDNSSQYYYLFKHLLFLIVGGIGAVLIFNFPTVDLQKNANKIMIIVLILLAAVLIPHVGKIVNGSRRWIGIGALNLQPSELAKISIAIYLANYLSVKTVLVRTIWQRFIDSLPGLGVVVLTMIFLLIEPDMGSTTVVFIITLSILYVANVDMKLIGAVLIIGIIGFISLVILSPYRVKRVTGFMDPWGDALGKGYQLSHSLLAIGHGGWFGVGLGNSIEKLFYLPEAHTDFILAIIGEECGVVGILVILSLFWVIFYRGFTIVGPAAKRIANRQFQGLLAQAISVWFFAQAVVNIGVNIGILPTKGLTLPFISFGGSSILINCISLAILLKIDYENKQIRRGGNLK